MKIIITGAFGFIGSALTNYLLEKKHTVYAVVRKQDIKTTNKTSNLHIIECDMDNYKELPLYLGGNEYDVFLHLAWCNVSGTKRNNVEIQLNNITSSYNAIISCNQINCRKFIFFGSSFEYKNLVNHRFVNPSVYGICKQTAHKLLLAYSIQENIHYNHVLFTNVFGIGDASNRSTNTILRALIKGESPKLVQGNYLFDWTYIDDAVKGIEQVILAGKKNKSYHIGNRKLKSLRDIVIQAKDIINPNIDLQFGTFIDNSIIDYSQIDLDALYNDTGFECQADFKDSIIKTAEWLKTQRENQQ